MNIIERIIDAIKRFFGIEETKPSITLDGNIKLVDDEAPVVDGSLNEIVPPVAKKVTKKKASKKKTSKKKVSKKKRPRKKKES